MSYIFPIGGGKGGIGKSFITANLGVLFARHGKKVVLVDLDLGGSNLHTFLGIKNPRRGLNEFINKTYKNLEHVVVPTIVPNLFMISSMNCSIEIANLFHSQKLRVIKAIQELPYEYVLLDLGAGTNYNTLDFFLTSNEGLFIFTPEPTSIENTVRFIRAAYLRKLKQILKQRTFNTIVKNIVDDLKSEIIVSSSNIFSFLDKYDPPRSELLQIKLREFKFKFVLNQFRKQIDVNLGDKIEKVCNRHFYSKFEFLGNISYDERVCDSIYKKTIFINRYPHILTAMELQNIEQKMIKSVQSKF